MCVVVSPSNFGGLVNAPPSKSFMHRAIFAAAMCCGSSVLKNIVVSDDIRATLDVIEKLGASYRVIGTNLKINGGLHTLLESNKKLIEVDCVESGATLRFLIPIAAAFGKSLEIKGRGRLLSRPIDCYIDSFKEQNIIIDRVSSKKLFISGKLKSGIYFIDGKTSSQFVTGLLMALPNLCGKSSVRLKSDLYSKPYVDLTLSVLKSFGIDIFKRKGGYIVDGNQKYKPRQYEIEGDYSQAAFFEVLGCVNPIFIGGLKLKSIQGDMQMLKLIERCGGNVTWENGLLKVAPGNLCGFCVNVEDIPDLTPPIAILACMCKGRSVIEGISRLKFKESDRIISIVNMLKNIGGKIIVEDDRMLIDGVEAFDGGIVDTYHDHRIAMAAAIAVAYSKKPITILKANSVNKSYPDFYKDYQSLGGIVNGICLE